MCQLYQTYRGVWACVCAALCGLVGAIGTVSAQDTLPVVDEVPWKPLEQNGREHVKGFKALKWPVAPGKLKSLKQLVRKKPRDATKASAALQKLLDPWCLIGVSINPESRVKAKRGPFRTPLVRGQPVYVLVKVHNDAGLTQPLRVGGRQLITAKRADGQWLEATILHTKPFSKHLMGGKVEYRVLRLIAREAGKREVTFQFDVGQGTQDLGFRAEVPILFTVRPTAKAGAR